MPRPQYFASPGRFVFVTPAPVAMITVFASSVSPIIVESFLTGPVKSTDSTTSITNFTPAVSACLRMAAMIVGPETVSGKPG